MKKIKELIINFINGFCMALADSVPGVSGGTIAFILGFYDKFIGAIDDIFRGNIEKKKKALIYLIKIGIGWAGGFLIAATILSTLFNTKIYEMSSLFLGFIIFAIPLVIKEEKDVIKDKYKNGVFTILGIALVVGITVLSTNANIDINLQHLNFLSIVYVFIVAMMAISAMILPGISGSTVLLIFGIYIPIMNNVKALLHLDFSVLPSIITFVIGILIGLMVFARIAKKCLEKHRTQTVYTILGLMIGSIYSIIMGPTTLDKTAITFTNFSIISFIIGGTVIVALELLKKTLIKKD